jgi:hypothetical protein
MRIMADLAVPGGHQEQPDDLLLVQEVRVQDARDLLEASGQPREVAWIGRFGGMTGHRNRSGTMI